MPQCVTCGSELHPERALKYDYCMAPECQEKNATGLTMVAIGVNKSAEQYMILDDRAREDLASGKYHDQRRGSFGAPAPSSRAAVTEADQAGTAEPARNQPARNQPARNQPGRPLPQASRRPSAAARNKPPATRRQQARDVSRPWSTSQEKLALLYNQQRLRPEEIAQKLGLSTYMVTQIILAARNQGKL
jgi:hypothetical protein